VGASLAFMSLGVSRFDSKAFLVVTEMVGICYMCDSAGRSSEHRVHLHWTPGSLHVLVEESPVEVTPDCVVDEPLWRLGLSFRLIPEHHVIVPSALPGKDTNKTSEG